MGLFGCSALYLARYACILSRPEYSSLNSLYPITAMCLAAVSSRCASVMCKYGLDPVLESFSEVTPLYLSCASCGRLSNAMNILRPPRPRPSLYSYLYMPLAARRSMVRLVIFNKSAALFTVIRCNDIHLPSQSDNHKLLGASEDVIYSTVQHLADPLS